MKSLALYVTLIMSVSTALYAQKLPIPIPRTLSENPAAYQHPRIFFTDADLSEHRDRAQNDDVSKAAISALRSRASSLYSNSMYNSFKTSSTGVSQSSFQDNWNKNSIWFLTGNTESGIFYGYYSAAAYVALMDSDNSKLTEIATSLSNAAAFHNSWYVPEYSNALVHDANPDLAFCYDILYNYMTDTQRATVRNLLSRMSSGRVAYGVGKTPHDISTNWRTHHDNIVIVALAIEGETGYDSNVYTSNIPKLDTFINQYGIHRSGYAHEGLGYFAFGMHNGIQSTLATARRDLNFFETSRLYQSLLYGFYELAPWGRGVSLGHHDGAGWCTGSGASAYYTIMKYMFPDDPLVDFIYTQNRYPGGNGRQYKIPLVEAIFGMESNSSKTTAQVAESKNLPLTMFCHDRGMVSMRSDWTDNAIRLDFECRMDTWKIGHLHYDRNNFTMQALGRMWIADPGYGKPFNDFHSTVLIDGVGQMTSDYLSKESMMPGKIVHFNDTPNVTVATGDASPAYNYQRSYDWTNSNPIQTPFTWYDFMYAPPAIIEDWRNENVSAASIYNPVQRAYRTACMVRGQNPFVIIVDDIQKDDAPHDYKWIANTLNNYPNHALTIQKVSATPDQIILKHSYDSSSAGPRLLIRVFDSQGDKSNIYLQDDSDGNRKIVIPRSNTVAPDYKVLLFPYTQGQSLPTTTFQNNILTVDTGDEIHIIRFNNDNGKTNITIDRNTGKVELFQDCNYQGPTAQFDFGKYKTADLLAQGFNNQTSSIVVPHGYTVTAFEDDYFRGSSKTISADIDCLDTIDFNDKISSMIVKSSQKPFTGTHTKIPGTIEAEDYDLGGQDISYYDTTTSNLGDADYRPGDDVDISQCSEGGYNIGWTEPGEWLEYSVDVEFPTNYNITFRVATESETASLSLQFDGHDVTCPVLFESTGNWQTYENVTVQNIPLTAGKQIMRLTIENGPLNINSITLAPTQTPYNNTPATIPGTIEAENFDTGPHGVAYYDKTEGNIGNFDYRSEDVDISQCSEGGCNIGWIETGEWLEYTVDVTESAVYDMQIRVASDNVRGGFHIDIDDTPVTGTITFEQTGGWQTYQTTTFQNHIFLSKGKHIIRLTADRDLWNLNWLKFTKSSKARGAILRQCWHSLIGLDLTDLTSYHNYPDRPTFGELITAMQCPTDEANYFGTSLRGYIHPPISGNYTFYVSSSLQSELWLSTNRFEDTITRIAHVPDYTNPLQWNKYPEQQSEQVYLQAGKKYYINCIHKESTTNEHLTVAWQIPGQNLEIIDGQYLSPWAGDWTFGDFSDDNTVNADDLPGFAALWLNENCPEITNIDKDENCRIDLYEFAKFTENWLEQ